VTWSFSQRSLTRLNTCHPDLQLLMAEALAAPECPCDFSITSGHRGQQEQDELYEAGRSKLRYPRSRHNSMPSLAVDAVPYIREEGGLTWEWEYIDPLASHILDTWKRLEIEERVSGAYELEWGGSWRWRDGAHYQINRVAS
tara:strand:- start:1797 stop:2222 length:426 start_codon:yes stop_codon:yes gene_type:complete